MIHDVYQERNKILEFVSVFPILVMLSNSVVRKHKGKTTNSRILDSSGTETRSNSSCHLTLTNPVIEGCSKQKYL